VATKIEKIFTAADLETSKQQTVIFTSDACRDQSQNNNNLLLVSKEFSFHYSIIYIVQYFVTKDRLFLNFNPCSYFFSWHIVFNLFLNIKKIVLKKSVVGQN